MPSGDVVNPASDSGDVRKMLILAGPVTIL
jgi:hypothetical protein